MGKMRATIDSESNARRQGERREGDRRRRRVSLVWPERRSGFERRGSASSGRATVAFEGVLTGLRDRPATLRVILLTVNMLNLADFLLTVNVLAMGGGEANPIMRSLFALNPAYAGFFKIAAILATSLVIWRLRRFRSALEVALVMLVVFVGVFFYHILGMVAFW